MYCVFVCLCILYICDFSCEFVFVHLFIQCSQHVAAKCVMVGNLFSVGVNIYVLMLQKEWKRRRWILNKVCFRTVYLFSNTWNLHLLCICSLLSPFENNQRNVWIFITENRENRKQPVLSYNFDKYKNWRILREQVTHT